MQGKENILQNTLTKKNYSDKKRAEKEEIIWQFEFHKDFKLKF